MYIWPKNLLHIIDQKSDEKKSAYYSELLFVIIKKMLIIESELGSTFDKKFRKIFGAMNVYNQVLDDG